MRVIAGEFRSRRIISPPGMTTRPTPERLRETLFDVLQSVIEGAIFIDAFAGTGAVGIEALSRGARHVVFIEKDKRAVEVIQKNLASLKLEARSRVISGAAALHLGHVDAGLVFLDPPYEKEREYTAALDVLEVHPPALTIVQHSRRFALEDRYGSLLRTRIVRQGDNVLSFYRQSITPGPSNADPRCMP